jgi:hypothetical protein
MSGSSAEKNGITLQFRQFSSHIFLHQHTFSHAVLESSH